MNTKHSLMQTWPCSVAVSIRDSGSLDASSNLARAVSSFIGYCQGDLV